MQRRSHRLELTTFVLALLAVTGLAYNMLAMQIHRDQLFLQRGQLDGVGLIALAAFVVVLLFNVVSFLWVMTRHRSSPTVGKIATLGLGALCMILLIGEKVMIDEIGRELRLGWETLGEWIILYSAMTIQLIYGLVVLAHVFREHRKRKEEGPDSSVPT